MNTSRDWERCGHMLSRRRIKAYGRINNVVRKIFDQSYTECNNAEMLKTPVLREAVACAYLAEVSKIWETVKPHNFAVKGDFSTFKNFDIYIDNLMYLKKCLLQHNFCDMCNLLEESLLNDTLSMAKYQWYTGIRDVLRECAQINEEYISQNGGKIIQCRKKLES